MLVEIDDGSARRSLDKLLRRMCQETSALALIREDEKWNTIMLGVLRMEQIKQAVLIRQDKLCEPLRKNRFPAASR